MKKTSLPLILIFLFFSGCSNNPSESEPTDILAKLQALPFIEVTEIAPHYGYNRAFQIDVQQPVDHNHPFGQQFIQRMYLSHADESMPMVFGPSGYGSSPQSVQEMAGILRTNHIAVVHRFFIDAKPDPLDWQYLNIRQAAADHHRIVLLFKEIYKNKWISSGVSKGGETVLFHKRFYPEDVDATIAYVAPIVFGTDDRRFVDFLQSVGSEECRNAIHQFQRMMLTKRDSLLTRFVQWFADHGFSFTRDASEIFESKVRSYDWNFWQRKVFACEDIPDENATYDEMLEHLATVVSLSNTSDERLEYFKPYYYQAFTEIGYPARNYDHIMDLLIHDLGSSPKDLFETEGVEVVYRPEVIQDVYQWLQTQGNNIIYIYGSVDPWTGGAVELTDQTNALKIIQPNGDHSTKIAILDEQQLVISTLEQWLGIEIDQVSQLSTIFLKTKKKDELAISN